VAELGRIAAIAVHYGETAPTLATLAAAGRSGGVDLRLVVVDHGPGPEASLRPAAEACGAIYLRPGRNLGFAGGLNRGIEAIRKTGGAELFLFLNNDLRLDPSAARLLRERFAAAPELGIAGPAITLASSGGEVWNAGSEILWPSGRPRSLFHRSPIGDLPPDPYPVGFVCGCALMSRAALLDRVGPMPEDYFLYFEDADFSFRARAAGFRVEVVPEARAEHRGGAAVARLPALASYLRSRNRAHFSRRWAPPGPSSRLARGWFLGKRILAGGAARRGALAALRGELGPPPPDLLEEHPGT
jgi:hypothetical protein